MKNKKIFNPINYWKTLNPKKKKTLFLMSFMILEVISSCFGQSTADAFSNLKSVFATIYAFFTSTYMLVICTVGLIVIGVQMITNRGEPVIMKKLVPWLFAVIIIGSASAICGLFFKPSTDVNGIIDGATLLEGFN